MEQWKSCECWGSLAIVLHISSKGRSHINQWHDPQTAGGHLNTQVIHLQGLPGDPEFSGGAVSAATARRRQRSESRKSPVRFLMEKWNLIWAFWWIDRLKVRRWPERDKSVGRATCGVRLSSGLLLRWRYNCYKFFSIAHKTWKRGDSHAHITRGKISIKVHACMHACMRASPWEMHGSHYWAFSVR